MSRQSVLESPDRGAQSPLGAGYGAHPSRNHPSPFLTLAEGATRYRFDVTAPKEPVQAFREWLARNAVPIRRRGRTILVEMAVVDAMLGR